MVVESSVLATLRANVQRFEEQLAEALHQAGRRREEVLVVAVTKYVSPSVAALLPQLGWTHLGESRPQELWRKAQALPSEVTWHQVGHLQRNKVRRTLRHAQWIHSADRWSVLEQLDRDAQALGVRPRVLLQVNISQEETKGGFDPREMPQVVQHLGELASLEICGLMGMSGLRATPQERLRQFELLRNLRDELQKQCPPQVELRELSMGMSGDFPQAVAQGATILRIGSMLFEGLESE